MTQGIRWLLLLIALLLPGCGGPNHEPVVRSRFQEFARSVCQDDVESCVKLADPVYMRAQGADKVKLQLKLLTGLFKLGKVTEADVRIDQIVIAQDQKSAEVQFSLQSKGQWKAQKPSRWVLSDGQWYLAF